MRQTMMLIKGALQFRNLILQVCQFVANEVKISFENRHSSFERLPSIPEMSLGFLSADPFRNGIQDQKPMYHTLMGG